MDGSQKLPQRILDPLFENITAARPHKRLLMVIAAWFRFVQSRTAGTPINDPIAEDLVSAVQRSKDDRQLVSNLLAIEPVFGDYPVDKIIDDLVSVLQELDRSATQGALKGMRA